MKRSEALEEIRKILAMNGKDDGMGELEEALLNTVESLGMLPPIDRWSLQMDGDNADPFNVAYYTWKPEDE